MVNEEANGNVDRQKPINLKNFPNFEMEDDFTIFKEMLENVFDILQIGEAQKSGILIAVLGSRIYKILKNLCNPTIPKTRPYADLIALLNKQFVPGISHYKERRAFYDSRQMHGETIMNWHLRIKTLAVDCEFGANLNEILKNQFISGLIGGKIFDRICEEDVTTSYEDILKIALYKEIIHA